QLPPLAQDGLAYILILTFGVLHGANDITLIGAVELRKRPLAIIHLKYIAAVLGISLIFLISKTIPLLAFVLISGYHFGEQHFGSNCTTKTIWRRPFFFSYGLTILFMIFAIKVKAVVPVIQEIIQLQLPEAFFFWGLGIVASIFMVLLVYLSWTKVIQVNLIKELFFLVVLGVVFHQASLAWGFGIYFVIWHSFPSLHDQLQFLYGKVSATTFARYLRSSWIYWGISIAGLAFLYFLLKDKTDYFITMVLYVLAAITFPHVMVMSQIEGLKNESGS
ncbi:MAG: Brp/Blh family beta-carotene 15,15'-dioxygenase, partial [Bacteroidota bacterium]